MTDTNVHFVPGTARADAASALGVAPLRPEVDATGFRMHGEDHALSGVPPTIEDYLEGFVPSQAEREEAEARRPVAQRKGTVPRRVSVRDHRAFLYELGPEPDPEETEPRAHAVVTWVERRRLMFLSSETIGAGDLLDIAASLYSAP